MPCVALNYQLPPRRHPAPVRRPALCSSPSLHESVCFPGPAGRAAACSWTARGAGRVPCGRRLGRETAQQGRWRLKTLLYSRRFYSTPQLINLYQSHVLSYLESTTPAVFHAAASQLRLINHVQEVFLRESITKFSKAAYDPWRRVRLGRLAVRPSSPWLTRSGFNWLDRLARSTLDWLDLPANESLNA